jgi:oligopeptidase A
MKQAPNPLLSGDFRIPFHRIRAEHIEPGIMQALQEAQIEVDTLTADSSPPTWENTIGHLEEIGSRLSEQIAPSSHLVSVSETPELREAYNSVLPEISAFWSRLPLNGSLWERVKAYAESEEAIQLIGVRKRHVEKTVRDFIRAGADLDKDGKKELMKLKIELAQLEQKFSENVLDATAEYELIVTDEARLSGVPEAMRKRAEAKAQKKGIAGWLLTLDYPSVEPIRKYCDDRELRREIHTAFVTRCRDGKFDNRPLLARILRLRDRIAELLGYNRFPDYVLEDRMAKTAEHAMAFERDLVERTRPFWARDASELRTAAEKLDIDDLEPWDSAYVAEKLRKERYDIDDETLRPYFALPQVLEGMFEIVYMTFGFEVAERDIEEVWHPDVRYYEIFDELGEKVGAFYTDWYPRKEKRQGAWMNHFITGGSRSGGFAPHLGVICGNFTPPDGDHAALLTHREVETIFHEFGHLLHHCTSRVEIPSRAGINVAWDWVELPSQLMENWTWEREALYLFARHHKSGEALPESLYERMVAARRFMGGWSQMRQLALGIVDLELHEELAPQLRLGSARYSEEELDLAQGDIVMEFGREHFEPFVVGPHFAELHILPVFTHLFSGGYAAAYYSYLWSEVLEADIFTRFRQEGIFNRTTGRSYVDSILSRGDSDEPGALFKEFMGRDPDPTALLDRNLGSKPA